MARMRLQMNSEIKLDDSSEAPEVVCGVVELKHLKVAIVHDWLPLIGGAEKVLQKITEIFPGSDIYTLFDFLTEDQKKIFNGCTITASYLNRLPGVERYYRKLLPLFPGAIESFDLEGYDLVISSSYSVAKGVITSASQMHISYVHSPARYAWDLTHHYLKQGGIDKGVKGAVSRYLLSNFRVWDYRTANGVDRYIANSEFIAKRIWKVYRRKSDVVYPPVDIDAFTMQGQKEDFYLTASRMVPYKRIDLIIEAFSKMPGRRLIVIGDGPEMERIASLAEDCGNIELLGYQQFSCLLDHMRRARAFIFAAEEDFGIVPVEAQACGTPVIAYRAGGVLETVIGIDKSALGATGVFFDKQESDSIVSAVEKFESNREEILPENCRANAERFSPSRFVDGLVEVVLSEFRDKKL